ncbi:MAG: hypothetical protein ACO39Z_06845 [Paracoccaceae bacterium]
MNLERIVTMIFRMLLRRGIMTVFQKGIKGTMNMFSSKSKTPKSSHPDAMASRPKDGPWGDANAKTLRERQRSINRISKM